MTCIKRKATDELTRNSVEIIEPIQPQRVMTSLKDTVYSFWSWCTYWCANLFATPPSYSTMTYGPTQTIAEDHVESSHKRKDGTTTLKRQKTRLGKETMRSRSTGDEYRKGGWGEIDKTEITRERLDAFWLPPEPGLLRKTSAITHAPKIPAFLEHPHRRYSDSSESPSSLHSPENNPRLSTWAKALERTAMPPPRDRARGRIPARRLNLEDSIAQLHLDKECDRELPASEAKLAQRAKLVEEIKKREREAAIRVAREARLYRKFPSESLVQPLNSKWEHEVIETLTGADQEVVTRGMEGTEIRKKDFRTLLAPRAWLNDEIINAYIEWIVLAANKAAANEAEALGEKPSQVPKFIGHNSFFYENLRKKGPSSTERLMKRKKAPGKSLMEVDSVFVPICQGNHWTIGVVRPVAKTIEYFDSMGGSSRTFISHMRSWLKFQLGALYKEEEWTEPGTACARQTNGYDCGVFVCTNAFCVALGIDTSCYYEREMTLQRRNIAAVLLNRGFNGDFAWNGGLLP